MKLLKEDSGAANGLSNPVTPFERRVVFFGGKGGVGKTTVAAAVATAVASQGRSVLIVSTDPAHSLSDALENQVGPAIVKVGGGLDAVEIDPEQEADEYIDRVKQQVAETAAPRLVREVERQIDVARVSPGAEESALFDRFARIMMEGVDRYELIVFDTAPTGHTLRLLSLPELMTAWIAGLIDQRQKVNALGRMWRNVAGAAASKDVRDADPVLRALEERRERFVFARNILTDPERASFFFVLTPERLPILETERAVATLDRYEIPVGGVIVNRILPDEEPGEFLASRRVLQAEMIGRAEKSFAGHRLWRIALQSGDVTGREDLLTLGNRLLGNAR